MLKFFVMLTTNLSVLLHSPTGEILVAFCTVQRGLPTFYTMTLSLRWRIVNFNLLHSPPSTYQYFIDRITHFFILNILYSFISLISLSYDRSKAPSKAALHTVRSRASSLKWQYPLLSSRSYSSFLRLLPRLPVTSIPPFIFPSITSVEGSFYTKCDQSS
jgi:hypothetical protein